MEVPTHKASFLAQQPLTGDGWAPAQEGIQLAQHLSRKRTNFTRIGDDAIWGGADDRRRIFKDCGMLLFDCRKRPWLLGCFGHGGSGTMAALEQMKNLSDISQRIRGPKKWTGRHFAIVQVNREIPQKLRGMEPALDTADQYDAKIVWP